MSYDNKNCGSRISLQCTIGGSFKGYDIFVVRTGQHYQVQTLHGRIGSITTPGAASASNLSLAEANSEAKRMAKSKQRKGYFKAA